MYIVANQLELTNGARRDRAECLVDAEQIVSPPAIQKRGSLYIITETETMADGQPRPGDIDLCREAQEIIVNEYYNSQLTATITSALRQAIEKANQAIFNHNSAALPRERRGIGLTVALVRNNEIYTAQLPPTQAFLAHHGEISYLPTLEKRRTPNEHLPPVQVRTGTDAQATLPLPNRQHEIRPSLGRYSLVEPSFNRNVFEEGDLLVLCSSHFAHAFGEEDMDWLLANQDSRNALLNLSEFARSHGLTDGYVLTISGRADFNSRPTQPQRHDEGGLHGVAESVAGAVGLFTGKRSHPTKNRSTEETFAPGLSDVTPTRRTIQPRIETPPVEPTATATDENWLHREDDDLNRPAYLRGRKLSDNAPTEASHEAFQNQQAGVFQLNQTPKRDFTYTDASQEGPTRPSFSVPSLDPEPPAAPSADPTEATTSKGVFGRFRQPDSTPRVAGARSDTPYFDLSGSDEYTPPPLNEPRLRPNRRPARKLDLNLNGKLLTIAGVAVLVVIALIILVVSLAGIGGSGGNRSKAADLVKSAEQKRASAQSLAGTNLAQARAQLNLAQADLDAAHKEKPDLPDLTTEQAALDTTRNNINLVVVPPDIRMAIDVSGQGASVRLSHSVISPAGDTLYLLDGGRNAIYSADPTGAVKTLLKSGDKSTNGGVFGKPVKIVARPDGILVLDDGNVAWIYNKPAGTWTSQTLGGTSGWTSKAVQQAASYQGNLYLLGPGNGQILKWNAGSYTGNPDSWLNPDAANQLSLDTAAGLSIDGTIYALTKDGKLLQMARPSGKDKGDVLQQFDLTAGDRLGPALSGPTGLNVGSLNFPYAFVLDSEKRLMQFSKANGNFIQQFQAAAGHKEFDNLQDVAIDETTNKVYLVGLQRVYVFNLAGPTNSPNLSPNPSGTSNATIQPTPGAANTVTIINNGATTTPAR